VLGFTHQKPSRAACFCEHCAAAARGRGLDPARAREGYRKLEGFAKLAAAGRRPSDGYFTTFWRLLLAYPEILAWNGMWVDHLRENYRAVHAKVKEARPAMKVGWAIAHNNCFNPLFRAENDIQAMTPYSDFLKTVAYHNSGGERTVRYIDNITRSVFADLEKQQALEMIYSLTGHRQGPLSEIARTGFTPDFVFREARRAVEGVTGSPTEIWTGLDLDLPTEPGHAKCTPEGTREIVKAAFQGGAHGVILARKYSEMRLSTLSGAGEAVKELGIS
jgi:hypothetical protein